MGPSVHRPCDCAPQAHLSLRWETRDLWWEINHALGAQASSETTAAVALALCVETLVQDRWTSYSRAKTHYDRPRRYRSRLYTYRPVVGAADALDARGLIHHDRRFPGERGRQSAMKATPELVERVDQALGDAPLHLAPLREPILLRDGEGTLIDYRDNRMTDRMRRDVRAQNEAIAGAELGGALPFAAPLRRIFNGDFSRGGRFYAEGGGWQILSKAERLAITIGGEPVVEIDYATFHPTLAYAMKGLPPPLEPYAVPGFPRDLVKIAFNVLLNSSRRHGARHAIAWKPAMARMLLGLEPGEGERLDAFEARLAAKDPAYAQSAHARADALIDALLGRHALIADLFFTGVGLALQRRDSDIAADVMREMRRRGVVVLPVHDSFLAPASKADLLEEVMVDAAARAGAAVHCKRSIDVSIG